MTVVLFKTCNIPCLAIRILWEFFRSLFISLFTSIFTESHFHSGPNSPNYTINWSFENQICNGIIDMYARDNSYILLQDQYSQKYWSNCLKNVVIFSWEMAYFFIHSSHGYCVSKSVCLLVICWMYVLHCTGLCQKWTHRAQSNPFHYSFSAIVSK